MKNKINIFSDKKIKIFLEEIFNEFELTFIDYDEIEKKVEKTETNIFFLNDISNLKLINFKNLNDNCLILSRLDKKNFNQNCKLIKTPVSISYIKTSIESFVENLNIQFHDISIINEKLTNVKNNSFCYLTKPELEILSHLIKEKESSKNFIKENILKIKSSIQTNSLDSHLTRIRKKMIKIKTSVKLQSKGEKLLIKI